MIRIIRLILLVVFGISIYMLIPEYHSHVESNQVIQEIREIDNNYEEYKRINSDYIGYLEFESGLISLPIVKSKDNQEYLNLSFNKNVSSQGTPFMDMDNSLDDQNIIIYGHNVYYDDKAMFTPLETLKDTYRDNMYLSLTLKDEVREYVITHVFEMKYEDLDIFPYYKNSFTEDEFNRWIEYPNRLNQIKSEESISYEDRFLTLQTCKKWDEDTHILVLCKEKSDVSIT